MDATPSPESVSIAGTDVPIQCSICATPNLGISGGWRANLKEPQSEPGAVAFYCPSCAKIEFGDRY